MPIKKNFYKKGKKGIWNESSVVKPLSALQGDLGLIPSTHSYPTSHLSSSWFFHKKQSFPLLLFSLPPPLPSLLSLKGVSSSLPKSILNQSYGLKIMKRWPLSRGKQNESWP